ncbi:MAG: zinc ABC transporter substrate-binding protein [Pseudomonadota bacterium]
MTQSRKGAARAVGQALRLGCLCASLLGLGLRPASAAEDPPRAASPAVAASIAPLHSLAAMVMRGVGEPKLLLRPTASAHSQTLRPSEAAALADADLVLWVGPDLEAGLIQPIATLARKAEIATLGAEPGLVIHQLRRGPRWGGNALKRAAAAWRAAQAAASGAGGSGAQESASERVRDPHFWLDPENAALWLRRIADRLAALDPPRAARYRENAAAAAAELDALSAEIASALRPAAGRPFVVHHDAYRYFEARYGLAAVGAVAAPGLRPSPARLAAIQTQIAETGAVCVFTEPQFDTDLARVAARGAGARVAAIDPLGAALAPGAELYPRLMRRLTEAFRDCLTDRTTAQ